LAPRLGNKKSKNFLFRSLYVANKIPLKAGFCDILKKELIKNLMTTKEAATGVVHTLPADLRKALISDSKALSVWQDITPLARNEWICWVTSGKKRETRGIRINKALSKLRSGMRRPCCWAGCIHR